MVAAEQFFSGHQWLHFLEFLKDTCSFNGAYHAVTCNTLIGSMLSCHLIEYMMSLARAPLVSTRQCWWGTALIFKVSAKAVISC